MSNKENQQPDGWVAWHPKGGSRKYTFRPTKKQTAKALADCYCNEEILARRLKDKFARGWRIRPVKIVFLDEEGE